MKLAISLVTLILSVTSIQASAYKDLTCTYDYQKVGQLRTISGSAQANVQELVKIPNTDISFFFSQERVSPDSYSEDILILKNNKSVNCLTDYLHPSFLLSCDIDAKTHLDMTCVFNDTLVYNE